MRRLRLPLITAGVAVLLFLVVLEATSNLVYLSSHGKLFYTESRSAKRTDLGAHTAAEAVFHPYFSFIHRVGREGTYRGAAWTTNNVGFQVTRKLVEADPGCCDYPRAARDDEIVVGIFGGSVASGFALNAQVSPEFISRLARIPAWSGKRIRVLNFSMPGFKQPQQLITLAYYLSLRQHFDVVVNIDGFNEIVTSHRNWAAGVEPSFPADTLWGEWGRILEKRSSVGEGASSAYLGQYYTSTSREWRSKREECGTASCSMLSALIADFYQWRARRLLGANDDVSSQRRTLFPTAIRPQARAADVFDLTADQWAESSRQMEILAKASGAIYLHVLQPNQWFKPAGPYEPIERDHAYKWVIELVNTGYPKLVARIPSLTQAGVTVLDATTVFRGAPPREIYADDCCHYTERGDAIFSIRIAELISKSVMAKTSTGK